MAILTAHLPEWKTKGVEELAKKITYIDLVQDSDFVEEYTKAFSYPGSREYFPTIYELYR